jgi:2-polyprenyl-3-methyl-5-hydroxy-6-metoxy-1,4-benzoquinol methylase
LIQLKSGNILCNIKELGSERREVTITSNKQNEYLPRETKIITDYEVDFIEVLFQIKGKHTCDELHREKVSIPHRLLSIVDVYKLNLENRQLDILDFGSGSSSSTLAIASMFKHNHITCLEIEEELIKLAKKRIEHHNIKNIEFFRPDNPRELPATLKKKSYDLCILNAVVEHMLPEERRSLLPQLWKIIKPGGHILIYETPHRWFPIEVHTTGLPFINYLPISGAWRLGSFLTKKNSHRRNKYEMLRAGLRGVSQREIQKHLGAEATLVLPNTSSVKDIIDMWYASDYHRSFQKKITYRVCKIIKNTLGIEITPWVTYVFKKPS